MIAYLFHVSILLAGCYFFYWLLLRQETFFRLNRAVLLACLVLPLILPLVTIPANWSLQLLPDNAINAIVSPTLTDASLEDKDLILMPEEEGNKSDKKVTLPIVDGRNNSMQAASSLSIYKILTYLYFTGVFIFALAFFIQLILIIAKKSTLNIIEDGKYEIVELVKTEAPFSFGRSIFINPASYDPDTYEQIVAHEKIHIDQVHFIDKILAELLLIMLWFNPFIWLFRKTISNNLEFLTDQSMLTKGFPKQAYQLSLFKVSAPQFPLHLTTNYNQSFLKNRIAMMNTKKSSARSIWKYLFILPLLGFSMMSLNTVEQKEQEVDPLLVEDATIHPTEEKHQTETPITTKETLTPATSLVSLPKKSNKIQPAKEVAKALNYGLWKGTLKGNKVCFTLDNVGFEERASRDICFLKEEINGFARQQNEVFKIEQEQGTLLLEGTFSNGKGQGVFKFKPNPSFVKFLKNEEMIEIAEENLLLLFFHKVDRNYIKDVIRQTINENIKRHSISLNDDQYVFAVVNTRHQQMGKADKHVDKYGTDKRNRTTNNNTNRSNHHSDGHVNIETINGTTYIQGAGTHNINGKVITVVGNETWVVAQDGQTYILEAGEKRKREVAPKRKKNFNTTKKTQSSSGIEKHYLKQSKGKGHLDWIGYSSTILEPSTQAAYQLPAFCKAFQRELVKDEIIADGDKILCYFGAQGAYVNGWHLSGGHATKFKTLAEQYDIPVSKGWNIELDGQNVLIINAVNDVEQLRIDLRAALIQDRLVANANKDILMKISGNRLIVNGKDIPKEKIANYFRLLHEHRITPAPGKIIQMGRKKNKDFIHVGYGSDNAFLGTFSTD